MNKPGNVSAWWYLRLVLQDYGLQYYKRINLYISWFLLYSVSLVVVLLYFALAGTAVELSVALQCGLNFGGFVYFIVNVLVFGESVNQTRRVHAVTVVNRILDLEAKQIYHEARLRKLKE